MTLNLVLPLTKNSVSRLVPELVVKTEIIKQQSVPSFKLKLTRAKKLELGWLSFGSETSSAKNRVAFR